VTAVKAPRGRIGAGGNIMAKYGLFELYGQVPVQEFEGDSMQQDGAFVKIFKNGKGQYQSDQQVAAIHLDKSQCVKVIQ
jgi:hypothetical protein